MARPDADALLTFGRIDVEEPNGYALMIQTHDQRIPIDNRDDAPALKLGWVRRGHERTAEKDSEQARCLDHAPKHSQR